MLYPEPCDSVLRVLGQDGSLITGLQEDGLLPKIFDPPIQGGCDVGEKVVIYGKAG